MKNNSFYYFKCKPIKKIENKYQFLRDVADKAALSATAKLWLEWIIFYYKEAKEDASTTARYFVSLVRVFTNGLIASKNQNRM